MITRKINFLKYRYVCFIASILFFAAGFITYFVKGGFTYHIDFVGGAEIRANFSKPLKPVDLRNALSSKGWVDYSLQSIGSSGKEYFVRVSGKIDDLEAKFSSDVKSEFPDNKMVVENIDFVGAEVGKDMQWNAFISVLLALLILLGYISIRMKYAYAIGAVVAIIHDMLAVLVFLLFFNVPISVNILAAILAILGYSLNDTIVIFSRIRENLKKNSDESPIGLINTSLNQTMTRTLLTSFSTLLAVGSFFVLGGETLRGFSFATMIGILVGTYSSVYIASPIMMAFGGLARKSQKAKN